jgi:DNA repair photolyase
VPVGVLVAPIIPGLNDRDVPRILEQAAACGASRASYSPVRLPGSVADVFLGRLRAVMPDAAGRVEARIRELRGGWLNGPALGKRMEVGGHYWAGVARLFAMTAARLGLARGERDRAVEEGRPTARQMMLFE